MVLRLLLRFIANNEHLVQRLSESYPIQRAARLVVNIFYKGKGLAEEHDIKGKIQGKVDALRIRQFFRSFADNVKQEIKSAKDEFAKKK